MWQSERNLKIEMVFTMPPSNILGSPKLLSFPSFDILQHLVCTSFMMPTSFKNLCILCVYLWNERMQSPHFHRAWVFYLSLFSGWLGSENIWAPSLRIPRIAPFPGGYFIYGWEGSVLVTYVLETLCSSGLIVAKHHGPLICQHAPCISGMGDCLQG